MMWWAIAAVVIILAALIVYFMRSRFFMKAHDPKEVGAGETPPDYFDKREGEAGAR